jgi:CMP-N-acetylneuraminic acid synthetase
VIALIPARAGSKRVPGKNTRPLAGHPLIAYTIAAAQQSGVFSEVLVCTDYVAPETIAHQMGAFVYIRVPVWDSQPDVEWIREVLGQMSRPESFAILRPTSPFRTAETIRRAFRLFHTPDGTHDSIRAVSVASENPYKMWTWQGAGYPMKPLLQGTTEAGVPLHSAPSQAAPKVWLQNSSLEMAYTSNVEAHGSIAGRKVVPFFTTDAEGFSIDTEADWRRAEVLAAETPALLPPLGVAGVQGMAETTQAPDPRGAVEVGGGVRGELLAPLPESPDDALWGV